MRVTANHEENNMKKVSFTNGYWFYFPVESGQVVVHGSGYSGKEVVYVNDDPISEKRNLGMSSSHSFLFNTKSYRVEISVVSFWRGEVKVSLYEDDKLVGEQNKAMVEGNFKDYLLKVGLFFLGGMAVGALGALILLMFKP